MSWATDHAISTVDTLNYNGEIWYPFTTWTVGSGIQTGGGLDSWLCGAVRFLLSASSTSGSNHILAQYSAFTNTGAVDTGNGYYLIRRLNSNITTYTGTSSSKGTYWSTRDSNQRQGLVKSGVLSGNLIWVDTPYIISDCGTFANNVSVSSLTFYVGTTQVISNVYQQTSISATVLSPGATPIKPPQVTYVMSYEYTNRNHYYRKWSNGELELFYCGSFATATGTSYSGKYYKDFTINLTTSISPDFYLSGTFDDVTKSDYISVALQIVSSTGLLTAQVISVSKNSSTNKLSIVYRVWNSQSTIESHKVFAEIRGRWKA